RYFEPETIEAALVVLAAAGFQVHFARPPEPRSRPLCCGRTFLAIGRVDEARREAERAVAALAPYVARGIAVIGLEPSCLFGFRDEIPALLAGENVAPLAAQALTFEEFLARQVDRCRLELPLAPIAGVAVLHGHCHQ